MKREEAEEQARLIEWGNKLDELKAAREEVRTQKDYKPRKAGDTREKRLEELDAAIREQEARKPELGPLKKIKQGEDWRE